MGESVKFTVQAGEPTCLDVVTPEGKRYQIRIVLGVFEVRTTDRVNPDGMPIFDVRAVVNMDVSDKQ